MQTSEDISELQKNKGHGFGLMNCKGIIDKYKKTNEIFRVCLFRIESELGKGSRFYFRLPKGVRKVLMLVLIAFLPVLTGCDERRRKTGKRNNSLLMIPFSDMINYWLLRMNMHTMFTIVTLMDYTNRHCVMRIVLYIV